MKNHKHTFTKKKVLIPTRIKEKLDNLYSKKKIYQNPSKVNFNKCISIIIYHQLNDGEDYVPIASTYWKKVFGGDYHSTVLAPLLKEEIIEKSRRGGYDYSNPKQQEIINYYRINPNLFDDNYEVFEFKCSDNDCTIYNPTYDFDNFVIKNKALHVSIDENKTIQWIDDNAENIFKSYYHPEFITDDLRKIPSKIKEFDDGKSITKHYTIVSKESNIPSGYSFFYYKNSVYLANYQEFHDYKIKIIKRHYKLKIKELVQCEIETSRSKTNHRLHNQLVTFPSKLLPFILINNMSTIQIDLRTSQFLIFANLINSYLNNKHEDLIKLFKYKNTKDDLKKLYEILDTYKLLLPKTGVNIHINSSDYTNDISQFINDVFFNDFYKIVQKELGFEDRGLTKIILFLLIFKRKTNSNRLTDKLIKKYNTVVSIMNDFKKLKTKKIKEKTNAKEKKIKTNPKDKEDNSETNQDSNFAVMLQCVESELFIDNILLPLQKRGIPCFSRHDSIVVAHTYKDEVIMQIKETFHKFGFHYFAKEDDFFWDACDLDEAERCGFLDYYSDQQELEEMCRLANDLEYQSSLDIMVPFFRATKIKI